MTDNRSTYENQELVHRYGRLKALFAAERNFLVKHSPRIPFLAFLDVGIGSGRTTRHIAPLVARYVGIDYSANMIAWCRQHLPSVPQSEFHVMDARKLEFASETFDVVLFSFNGIDCVSYEHRMDILKEFFRVLKPGGTVLFSFHNAYSIPLLYSFQMPRNPLKWPREIWRWRRLRALNGPWRQYVSKEYFYLYDGADDFQTLVCYARPERQIADLKNLGFTAIETYDLKSGRKVLPEHRACRRVHWMFVEACKP